MRTRLPLALLLLVITSCGGQTAATTGNGDGGTTPATTGAVGDPCVPFIERDPGYLGGSEREISVELKSPSCASGICLANHFRGRVTCPYGQDETGAPPAGATACTTPDGGAPVTGHDGIEKATVAAQCTDRHAADVVTCSCRCANAAGKTDDGHDYCACSGGTVCAPIITSIGSTNDDVSGSYCIKPGTLDDSATDCPAVCDPVVHKCP